MAALFVSIGLAASTSAQAQALSTRFQGQVALAAIVVIQPSPATPGAFLVTELAVIALQGKGQFGGSGPPIGAAGAILLAAQSEVLGTTTTLQFLFLGLVDPAPIAFDAAFPKVPTQAALSAAFVGVDLVSGSPWVLTLEMAWTGTGGQIHENALTRVAVDGLVVLARSNGFHRESTAVAGTIAGLPTPVTLAGGPVPPLAFADLASLNLGQIVVGLA